MLVTTTGSKQFTNSSSNIENMESIPIIGQQANNGTNNRKAGNQFFHRRDTSNGDQRKKQTIFEQQLKYS
jgi:hypothetical protein